MPLRTHQVEEPALNLTPMIDIVFLLVIFFMVGSQFTDLEREFQLRLARVGQAQPLTQQPAPPMVVSVPEDGQVRLGSRRVTLAELERELLAAKAGNPQIAVRVRIAAAADWQQVAPVLEIIKQRAGIANVSLPVTLGASDATP